MKKQIFLFVLISFFVTTAIILFPIIPVEALALPSYLRPSNLPTVTAPVQPGADQAQAEARLLIGKVINWIFGIVGLIAVWAVVNNAFWLVVAVGKGETIDQRKKALFWAVGGLILLILSYTIIQMVVRFVINVAEEAPAVGGPAPTPSPSASP